MEYGVYITYRYDPAIFTWLVPVILAPKSSQILHFLASLRQGRIGSCWC